MQDGKLSKEALSLCSITRILRNQNFQKIRISVDSCFRPLKNEGTCGRNDNLPYLSLRSVPVSFPSKTPLLFAGHAPSAQSRSLSGGIHFKAGGQQREDS